MEGLLDLLGSDYDPGSEPILGLPSYKLLAATRAYEESLLLPLLSVEDLQSIFEITKPKAERIFNIFHETGAKTRLVNALEVFAVATFTAAQESAFTTARKLVLLFDADQDLIMDGAECTAMLSSLFKGLIKVTGGFKPTQDKLDGLMMAVYGEMEHRPTVAAVDSEVPFESWYHVLTRHAVVVSKIRRQLDLPGIEARRAEAAAQQAAAKRDGEQGAAKNKGKDAGSALGRRARIRTAGKAVASALQPRRFATLDHTDVLELLTLFDGLDADGDGTVTRLEFVKKLQYTLGSRADKIFSAMDANLSKELSFLEMAAHCFPNVEGNSLQDAIVLASTHVALRHKRLRLLKLLLSDKQRAAIMEIFEQLLPTGETTVTLTALCARMSQLLGTPASELQALLVASRLASAESPLSGDDFMRLYLHLIQHDTDLLRYLLSCDAADKKEADDLAAAAAAAAVTQPPIANAASPHRPEATTTLPLKSPTSPQMLHPALTPRHRPIGLAPQRPEVPCTPRTPRPFRRRQKPQTPRSIMEVLDNYRDNAPIVLHKPVLEWADSSELDATTAEFRFGQTVCATRRL